MKRLIVFDLDGAMAESKSSLDAEMSALLRDALCIVKVAVISGGNWPQFEKQLLFRLPHDERLKNLTLLPTCGTKFLRDEADSPLESHGTVANVVFPTGIDRRGDLGPPDRFDVYYVMADNRIGVARLDVPGRLPAGAFADRPKQTVSLVRSEKEHA